ncbi:MAG TPA: PQQ-binding-like beta-propeller repeat protein [Gemmataceae bacterium]|nr:PQQ-binding-like beta-propeller repeat protein [Gemmataceae bacterium]
MKLSHRTLVVVTAGLLLLPALGLESARPAEDQEKEKAAPSPLATDAGAAMQLQAAADSIQEEDWKSALRLLQHLLDDKRNTLARLGGGAGKAERIVSVHTEAERLLASLPEAGRKAYQQTYGPRAADLLESARTVHDDQLFARVVARYLYTDAGPVALRELARQHYKKGRLLLATLGYSRLLEHVGPARWSNDDLYQAAVAFHHCGTSAHTEQMLKQLRARTEQNIIRLGKRKLTVEELRKEIERAAPSRQALHWPVYRGDSARRNRGAGDPPLLEAMWRRSMFYGKDFAERAAKERVQQAEKTLQSQKQPIISAFSPIALTARNHRGEEKSLLIYKNYFGVMTVDLSNGSLGWLSPSNGTLQRMFEAKGSKQTTMAQWLNYFKNQYPQILFENSTVGTFSTDGKFVYVVEDLAVPPPPPSNLNNGRFFPGGMRTPPSLDRDLEDAVSHNSLFALSLARSGALTWALGDAVSDEEKAKDPFRDHYFLGPPLPLAGRLYVLADKQQEIRLICLETIEKRGTGGRPYYTPRVVSTQTLGNTQDSIQDDPLRRTWAAHLAYGEGILVCPTNAGTVFGVSLLENSLVWAYPYRDKSDAGQPGAGVMPFRGRTPEGWQLGLDGMLHKIVATQSQWKLSAPVISDGKVVFAAPDSRSLHCINLRDGSPVWQRPKLDDDLYLGNVADGKVLIVGKKTVRALSLATGETLWTRETGIPSGQGIATGTLYYLPLQRGAHTKEPEILVLDIDKGRVIAHNKTRSRTPGNLVFVEGKLISQSPWEVVVYPSLKGKLKEANEGVEKHPGDPARLIDRAVLRLSIAEQQGAVEDLRAALSKKLDKETRHRARALLFEALSEWLSSNLPAAEAALKEYKELTEVDLEGLTGKDLSERRAEQRRRQQRYYLLVARLRESQGRLTETLQAYFDLKGFLSSEEMLPLPDDPAVKVRLDVWIRGRIAEVLKKATPEQRKQMEAELERRLKEIQGRDDEQGQAVLRGAIQSSNRRRRVSQRQG